MFSILISQKQQLELEVQAVYNNRILKKLCVKGRMHLQLTYEARELVHSPRSPVSRKTGAAAGLGRWKELGVCRVAL